MKLVIGAAKDLVDDGKTLVGGTAMMERGMVGRK
jgi:hypothetical protein